MLYFTLNKFTESDLDNSVLNYSYFMLNTAHLYFSERGLDLDCTDVFFKTARISVPAPNKVRISYDYYKHKY